MIYQNAATSSYTRGKITHFLSWLEALTYFELGLDKAAAVGRRRAAKVSYISSIHLQGNITQNQNKEKLT